VNRLRRSVVLGAIGVQLLRPIAGRAAKTDGPRRIGILSPGSGVEFKSAFSKALRVHGWVEGRDVVFENAGSEADPTAEEVAKLLAQGVEILVTAGTVRTRALRNATRTIPIVTTLTDPVSSGFAQSIARPGGNVTGVAHGIAFEKRIDLVRQLVPHLDRIGISVPPRLADLTWAEINAARAVGISATVHWAKDLSGMDALFKTMRWRDRAAVDIWNSPEPDDKKLLRLAIERGVATIVPPSGVELGGLMSCESMSTIEEQTEVNAAQVDEILRGANPAEIPFQLPSQTRVGINLRTAAALKLPVSAAVVLQADQVIR
jgi:putative ABC transport system substrate-binding protein